MSGKCHGTAAHSGALARIAANAEAADAGRIGLAEEIETLTASGLLAQLCHPDADPLCSVALLRALGRANLSVGRLAEGHMNALRLLQLYGTQEQQERLGATQGHLWGVWGADDTEPVRITAVSGSTARLTGAKRFASGLGIVRHAVVTAATEGGTQLVVAAVDDPHRADASGWQTTGMRATASGTYDLTGTEAEVLGRQGDYEREPYFEGGVWRYAALQVGALEALTEDVRLQLAASAETEAQLHRIARLSILCHGARLLVEDAAIQVEASDAGPAEVALSLVAREGVEAACLEGIALADRAMGTRSFVTGGTAERIRRDLSFFLRQADLDGKLRRVGQTLCRAGLPCHELWDHR